MLSLCDCNVVEDLCHFLLLCPALEKLRRPLLNDTSFNTVELDFVDLPYYIKIKWLIGDCGFYINEIEGMYLKCNWKKSHFSTIKCFTLFLFSIIFINITC